MADGLRILSVLMAALGAWLLYSGFNMDVTVPGYADVPRIANAQLMHVQLLNFLLGSLAIIDSTVLLVGAAIVGAVDRKVDGGNGE